MSNNPNFFPNGYQDPMYKEEEFVQNWPYRTTPLVLAGAKVRREQLPCESYLRHHPNPSMRMGSSAPSAEYMKQKVAEAVLQKVASEEAGIKYPPGRQPPQQQQQYQYADPHAVRQQQSSPHPANGHYAKSTQKFVKRHKPTMLYDPAKSETYKALQEEGLGDVVHEVPVPVHPKVFTAPPNKRPAPTPKPPRVADQQPRGKQNTFVSSLRDETIQQSNSFKRLMYHVLGESEF